jgi:hypothetical protein
VTTFSSARRWAASQSMLSAGTTRQLNEHPGVISGRLERADGRAATLIPELNNLPTAINNQSRLIGSLNIARTDSPDTREDHDPAFPPNAGKPVGGTP